MVAMRIDDCLTTLRHAARELAQKFFVRLLPLLCHNVL